MIFDTSSARFKYGDRVRVVHVLPPANLEYQQSLPRPEHQALGGSAGSGGVSVSAKLLRMSIGISRKTGPGLPLSIWRKAVEVYSAKRPVS